MTKAELYQKACMLPLLPGVYIIRDKSDTIIYIGKAKRLRIRVSQYFREGVPHDNKVSQMIAHAYAFDVIVCQSEFEALVLEATAMGLGTCWLGAGFYPDIISSDLVRVSEYTRPGFSLLYAMSVNSAAGMPTEKILQSVTYTPAKSLGIEEKAGVIREGAPADVAILDIRDVKDKTFTDNYGNSISGNKLFVPLMTVKGGRTAYRQIFF